MAYCMQCGKMIENGKFYCPEHSRQQPVSPYMPPAKTAPLWMFPVFALAASVAGALFTMIGSLISNSIISNVHSLETEFLNYISLGQVIPPIIFFVFTIVCMRLYNKTCNKNGLANSVFPVYYCGVFYICNTVGAIVGNLLRNSIMLILSIEGANRSFNYSGDYAYSLATVTESITRSIVFVITTLIVFSYIHKKQTEKSNQRTAGIIGY